MGWWPCDEFGIDMGTSGSQIAPKFGRVAHPNKPFDSSLGCEEQGVQLNAPQPCVKLCVCISQPLPQKHME